MHTLVTGATATGKSSLLRAVINARLNSGRNVIIYDPLRSFDTEIRTVPTLLETLKKNKNATVIIDEANTVFDLSSQENNWILTMGRHWGYEIFCGAQRLHQINPTARGQFSRFYCFRISGDDQKLLENNFACRFPEPAQHLPQGTYFHGRYEKGKFSVTKEKLF